MKHGEIIAKLTRRQKADLLTGKDFWSTLAIDEIGLPSAYLADGPHGVRKQAAASDHLGLNVSIPATCFPTAATMANSWNEELGEKMGELLGEEAAAEGVNVLLGPGLNIKRNPRCGRNFEYFSEDPMLAGKMAAAYVRGIQKSGVSACLKHYAVNSQEERRMVSNSVLDERALREIYLAGFEIAVKEGKPKAVMSSYNLVNGEYVNENKHLIKEILRGEWGFNGIVVTDWAGCNDRVEGVRVGSDLEMPASRYGADDVYKALEDGTLEESAVDECLDRLIDLILSTDAALKSAPKTFDKKAHHDFARKCAEESIVLLKNDGALPLRKEKVCFIGDFANEPRYQGAGSSAVNPTMTEKFISAQKNYEFEFTGYAQGFKRYGKKSNKLAKKALKLAAKSDTVLFFAGLDEVTETEGLDRENIKLPQNQLQLLRKLYKLNKKVVVALFCGSAVELDAVNDANAVIHAYLGGQAGVTALLNVLTGKVNPSGKLSESYPLSYESCPSKNYFHAKQLNAEYRESVFVGYRYYATAGVETAYPFGHGLSYTKFEYSDLSVDDNGATLTVKNVGAVDGSEVVQLYISKQDCKIFRPSIELKGFKKVFVNAGESVTLTIPFDEKTFAYFDVKTNRFEIEGGEYIVKIGASSGDIRLDATVQKSGTVEECPYDMHVLGAYAGGKVQNIDDKTFKLLLGRDIPEKEYEFYKKKRMVIGENTTVADLRYSRRWAGRLFAWGIRFARGFLCKTGHKAKANVIDMGVTYLPIRGLAKFGGMSRRQMEALIMMFNGHLFKGVGRFLSKENKPKKK